MRSVATALCHLCSSSRLAGRSRSDRFLHFLCPAPPGPCPPSVYCVPRFLRLALIPPLSPLLPRHPFSLVFRFTPSVRWLSPAGWPPPFSAPPLCGGLLSFWCCIALFRAILVLDAALFRHRLPSFFRLAASRLPAAMICCCLPPMSGLLAVAFLSRTLASSISPYPRLLGLPLLAVRRLPFLSVLPPYLLSPACGR